MLLDAQKAGFALVGRQREFLDWSSVSSQWPLDMQTMLEELRGGLLADEEVSSQAAVAREEARKREENARLVKYATTLKGVDGGEVRVQSSKGVRRPRSRLALLVLLAATALSGGALLG